jgi:3-oxoacyl-[acyl-carrier protein] reductase
MKIAIIGGASGLGKAITTTLAAMPQAQVLFTYSSSLDAAEQLTSTYSNTSSTHLDFTDQASILSFLTELKTYDADVLVNNAITSLHKNHFHKIAASQFADSFAHNVLPILQITQQTILGFRKKKFGKIINILTSYLANKPPLGLSEYVANKAYLESMSKSWASENAGFNITSNCISPSLMATRLTSDTDERIIETMLQQHPLKALITPVEVAEMVAMLIHSSQHLNGTNIYMNAAENVI